jgi:superfamily II RNA helicase
MRSESRLPRALALFTLAAVAFAVAPVDAQWAWRDDNGRVMYSDRPPPPNIKASAILRQPPAAASAASSTTPSPTSGADDAAKSDTKPADAPKTLAEREMEFRKRQQERAATERKAQEEQQKSAAKAADCERSRGYLRALEEGQRITRTDASGNREFLDDAQRAQEVERTRKLVQSLCN